MMKKEAIYLVALIFIFLVACTATAGQEETADSLVSINLPMGYIADPQFAPFYVAADKGYFAEEGLDVTFDYGFETDGVALVGSGERPFAVVSGEQVVLARAQELPVVYVFEWFQRYPIAVISLDGANIQTPADLVGKEVGLPGFWGASYVGYLGLLSANGIAPESINASDIGFTQVESLLAGQSDAVVGYVNNEPVQLAALDESIQVLDVADYIDLVANGLITNEETIANNPELVRGFVHAVYRGLQDTLADPAAAYAISQKYVEGLDESRFAVLEASLPLWQADTLGVTDSVSWDQTQAVLLNAGLLDALVSDLEAAYTNEFVPTP